MKRSSITASTLSVFSVFTVGSVLAQDASKAEFEHIPAGISDVVADFEESGYLDKVVYADLDGNADPEAVVFLDSAPASGRPGFREWRVIDDENGVGVQVGTWYGDEVEVVETASENADDPIVSVIVSDGSLWYYYKSKMRPFGDLVSKRNRFIHPGRPGDVDLFSEFGIDSASLDHMARVKLDLPGARGDEVLVSLMGDGYWREEDGATPYILRTAGGDVIHSGWSFTHPSVYLLPEGGFQLIEAVHDGYRAIYFPVGEVE